MKIGVAGHPLATLQTSPKTGFVTVPPTELEFTVAVAFNLFAPAVSQPVASFLHPTK